MAAMHAAGTPLRMRAICHATASFPERSSSKADNAADIMPRQKGGSMKQPEDMSVAELRAELREMGVTERLMSLILREMGEAEQRLEKAQTNGRDAKYDPLRAQLFILKSHGMTTPDLALNRKGKLFIALTTREDQQPEAQSA
jgi:hypothetical protein